MISMRLVLLVVAMLRIVGLLRAALLMMGMMRMVVVAVFVSFCLGG